MPTLAIGRLDSNEDSDEQDQNKADSASSVSVDYDKAEDEHNDAYNYAFKPKKNQKMSSFGRSRRRFEDKRSNTIFMPPYADIGTLIHILRLFYNLIYRDRKA